MSYFTKAEVMNWVQSTEFFLPVVISISLEVHLYCDGIASEKPAQHHNSTLCTSVQLAVIFFRSFPERAPMDRTLTHCQCGGWVLL